MSWVSAADTHVLSGGQQVRVHFAQSCYLNPSNDQILQALLSAGGPDGDETISSVSDVSADKTATFTNPLSVLTQYYIATINPVDGIQAGDLRNTVYNALVALSSVSMVSCKNWAVGTIEYDDGVSFAKGVSNAVSDSAGSLACAARGGQWDGTQCIGGGLGLTTSLGLLAVAVVAVVVLILLKK